MSVEKHVHLIAVLWIVMGAISFVSGLLLFGFLFGISLIPDLGSEAPIILRLLGSGIGFFLWLFSLPKIICGFGLISHREWARVLILVLSSLPPRPTFRRRLIQSVTAFQTRSRFAPRILRISSSE